MVTATSELRIEERGHRAFAVSAAGVDIATYVFDPDVPAVEARKPYLHPMRTTSGAVVSAFRPWDHRWHKGLQLTSSVLSGENFWGGKTFRAGEGYLWLDNVGQMRHEGFAAHDTSDRGVLVTERLAWITHAGERWVDETRSMRFSLSGPDAWLLDYSSVIANTRGEPLEWGSPTTQGRPDAGYTGLFWRGPRSWTGGEVIAPDGRGGEEMMGRSADWLAITGRHDEIEGGATVLFFAGSSSADVPLVWFVRSQPYACLNPSPAFREEFTIPAGGELRLAHRVAVIDRMLTNGELEAFAARNAI